MPTSLDTPCANVDGRWSRTSSRPNSATNSSIRAVEAGRPGWIRSRRYGQPAWSSAATRRLSRTVISSNSSTACHDRTIPARARRSTVHESMPSPSKWTVPLDCGVKPVTTSSSVVLPAPLGPISPHLAGLDGEADGVEGDDAAEADDDVPDLEGGRGPAGPGAYAAARRLARRSSVRRCHGPAPLRGDAVGRLPQHEHGADAGQDRQPRDDVGPPGRISLKIVASRAPGLPAADDTRHPGDAADDGVLHEQHRADHAVLPEPDVRLAQRQQHPAQCGDGGGDGEGVGFAPTILMPSDAARSLLTASSRVPTRPRRFRHQQAHDDEHDQHEPAVALRVLDGIEVDAGTDTPSMGRPSDAAGDGAVGEDQRVEHQRQGEGGDGQARALRPHRGRATAIPMSVVTATAASPASRTASRSPT